MIEKIKRLLESSNWEDHQLAIIFTQKLSKREIKAVYNKPESDKRWSTSSSNWADVPSEFNGLYYIVEGGYLGYNGLVWFVTNKRELTKRGYKLAK